MGQLPLSQSSGLSGLSNRNPGCLCCTGLWDGGSCKPQSDLRFSDGSVRKVLVGGETSTNTKIARGLPRCKGETESSGLVSNMLRWWFSKQKNLNIPKKKKKKKKRKKKKKTQKKTKNTQKNKNTPGGGGEGGRGKECRMRVGGH